MAHPTETILVTGGAGFIGSALVRHLLGIGAGTVINVDCLTYAGNLDNVVRVADHVDYTFAKVDIRDRAALGPLFTEHRPTVVIHLAAESHVDRSIDGPRTFIDTNVVGTLNLLEAARAYWQDLVASERSAFRFLHVSTDEVYGSLGETGRFREDTRYDPHSPYSASKAASDHLVRAWQTTFGLPTLITNCSNNYGPYQFPEKLIPLMILNAVEGKPLPVYGTGANVRDWLFVKDHVRALWIVAKRGAVGETYNIGGRSERTNLEVVEHLCTVIDEILPDGPHRPTHDLITVVEDRPGHDLRYAIDDSKIAAELGFEPSVDFNEGLRRTVLWYLQNRDWCERCQDGSYRRERLGLTG